LSSHLGVKYERKPVFKERKMRNRKCWREERERKEEHGVESRGREREQGPKEFKRKKVGRRRTSCGEEKIGGPDVV
jgi:hypothetical protein